MDSTELEKLKRMWTEEQNIQRRSLVLMDPPWLINQLSSAELLVAGFDISFSKRNENVAVATLAVIDMHTLDLVYEVSEKVELTVPYIPTFLAYREVGPFERLYAIANERYSDRLPHLLMVDGNGTLHPRGFGCACLLGYRLNRPTIGVAKNLLETDVDQYGTSSEPYFKHPSASDAKHKHREQLIRRGDRVCIYDTHGTVCGVAMLNTNQTTNPVYVSPGHLISLDTACDIVLKMSRYRTPEPTRLADQISRKMIQRIDAQQHQCGSRKLHPEEDTTEGCTSD